MYIQSLCENGESIYLLSVHFSGKSPKIHFSVYSSVITTVYVSVCVVDIYIYTGKFSLSASCIYTLIYIGTPIDRSDLHRNFVH